MRILQPLSKSMQCPSSFPKLRCQCRVNLPVNPLRVPTECVLCIRRHLHCCHSPLGTLCCHCCFSFGFTLVTVLAWTPCPSLLSLLPGVGSRVSELPVTAMARDRSVAAVFFVPAAMFARIGIYIPVEQLSLLLHGHLARHCCHLCLAAKFRNCNGS